MVISEARSGEEKDDEKTSGCPRQLNDLNTGPIYLNYSQDMTCLLIGGT